MIQRTVPFGSRQPLSISTDTFSQRMAAHPGLAGQLRSVGLPSIYTLLGCYLADGTQLLEFAGPGPLNTDEHPSVLFQAPEFVYSQETSSTAATTDRIMTVVQAFAPHIENILAPTAAEIEKVRLAAYWEARNAYLRLGARTTPSDVKYTCLIKFSR
jgi:spermidine synthase